MSRTYFKYETNHIAFIHRCIKDGSLTWSEITDAFNEAFHDELPVDDHGDPQPIKSVRQTYYYRMQDDDVAEEVAGLLSDPLFSTKPDEDIAEEPDEAAPPTQEELQALTGIPQDYTQPRIDYDDKGGGFYMYDTKQDLHTFHNGTETERLSTTTLRDMKKDYSNELGRQYALTVQQMAEKYDMSRNMVVYILKKLGWVHDSTGWLPQDFADYGPEALADRTVKSLEGHESVYRKHVEKKLAQMERKLAKKALEDNWKIEKGMKLLNRAIPKLSTAPPKLWETFEEKTEGPKAYFGTMSDFHEQQYIYGPEMFHEMSYNKSLRDVFIDEYLHTVYTDVKNHWNYDFDKAYFADIGDLLDGVFGRTIAGTIRGEQDTRGIEAVRRVVEIYRKIYYGYASMFKEVEGHYIPGNHEGPWSHVVHDVLKEHFGDKVPNVNIMTHSRYIDSFTIGNSQILLFHEKVAGRKGSMPGKEGPKREAGLRFLFMLPGVKADYTSTDYHYVLTGHYHTFRSIDSGHYREIRVPSPSPADQHADGMFLGNRPGTLGFLVDYEHGIEMDRHYHADHLYTPDAQHAA